MLFASSIAFDDRSWMAYKTRPKPGEGIPDSVKKQEGRALHKLWTARKRRTQAEFAAELDYSEGYFPQFFSGMRPLTTDLAVAFAAELAVDVSDFSPRLAKELQQSQEAAEWPFQRITRAQYRTLNHAQREAVEAFVATFVPQLESVPSRQIRRVR
jgi:hypothetical protein